MSPLGKRIWPSPEMLESSQRDGAHDQHQWSDMAEAIACR